MSFPKLSALEHPSVHSSEQNGSLFSRLVVTEALELAKEAMECGCFEKMQSARDQIAEALGLEESRRRRMVRTFRHIRVARNVKIRRKGKGSAVRNAKKLHHAVRRGPMFNRHRR